jgi:hypothetical protein
VNGPGAPASRRDLFAPHVCDPLMLRRCPVCAWAIEQDHAEALALHARSSPRTPRPAPERRWELEASQELVVVGFALV